MVVMRRGHVGDQAEAPPTSSRFRIVRRLGAGGMGVVFEALDLHCGTRVALKCGRRLDPEVLLRFKTEFRALQDLEHPNLVRLDELICDGGQWFFTMELIDGVDFLTHVSAPTSRTELASAGTLEDGATDLEPPTSARVDGAPATPPASYKRYFDETRLRVALAQLVQGVTALHAAGKVHRDIKPSNILVTPEGRVVLLDFGIIADVRRGTDGHAAGTPLYMAPEQTDACAIAPAADWYAVGLVLFQSLTGRLPFGASPFAALALKKRIEPPAPGSLVADLPADLDRLCVDLLRLDPGDRPDGMEVLRRLSVRTAEPWPAGRFIGRVRELDALESCFTEVRNGGARTLLVHGESGTGKTALVSKFLEQRDRDVVVLAGRCCERESVPYKAVDELVDSLSWYLKRLAPLEAAALLPAHGAALAQVFPVLQRVPVVAEVMHARSEPAPEPRELRLRAFAALRELFANIARRQPLVLAIDDLQWADADSMALLGELVSPPAPAGVLLLATVRSPSGVASGADRLSLPAADDLHVTGLAPDEARALAASLLARERAAPDDPGKIAAVIASESAGHPLFIDELVRRKVALGMASATPRLDEALAARVHALGAQERAILELTAIAGAPLAQDHAAAAAGLALGDLARRVASLRAVNLIRSAVTATGHAVEPYHDRVRRVVVAGLAPMATRALHLRLAETLERRGGDAETLAVHFHEAGEARRAAAWAGVAATRAATALAFDRAASLFRMAAEYEPASTAEGKRLRVGLAEALANAGHGAESARTFEEAAAAAAASQAVLQQRAAEQYLRAGHIDSGVTAIRRVLEPLGLALPRTPHRALASLALRRAQLRLRGLRYRERAADELSPLELRRIDACYLVATSLGIVDHVRGADFQTRNLLWALRAGEPYRISRALAVEAGYAATRGVAGRARAEHLLGLAGRLAAQLDPRQAPHALGLVDCFTGLTGLLTGDWSLAREHCERARVIWRERCLGVAWELDSVDFILLWAVLYQGELAELARRMPTLLRDAEERGDLYAATNLRTSFVPILRLAADQPVEARAEGAAAARGWSRDGFHLQHYNFEVFADGQISLYLGEPDAAHHRISGLWPALRASMLMMIQQLRIEALHVRARCALAAATAAEARARTSWLRSAERDTRRIARERAPWSRGWIDLLASGLAAARGDCDAAVALARRAASGCDDAGMRLYAAAARRRLGELLRGGEGEQLVADADAWMASQGIRDPRRMTAVLAPGLG
jgi:serine/threonine protein kinase